MPNEAMPDDGVERVRAALRERGVEFDVSLLADSTRTAADAAAALGCEVAQIVKSLVFHGVDTDRPVLVLGRRRQPARGLRVDTRGPGQDHRRNGWTGTLGA